jgi:hypothetical protein
MKEAKMSEAARPRPVEDKTRELLRGPLKHVRAAALAAALVPLASVATEPVLAQCNPSSGIECPPPLPTSSVPQPCDKVTGGGFIITNSGAKGNFGSHGGCKHRAFWGHVNYVDHGGHLTTRPYHVDSTQITGYLMDATRPKARDICGFARTNAGEMVRFRVRMEDNGEPGINDEFGIRLSNGYHQATRPIGTGRGGGNVQLHKSNPSTTPPSPTPTEVQMCGVLLPP